MPEEKEPKKEDKFPTFNDFLEMIQEPKYKQIGILSLWKQFLYKIEIIKNKDNPYIV